MGREMFEPVVTILAGIIGIAIIAVLVSQKSNTAGVFSAAGGAFANAVSAAVSPVTGASAAPNVNAGTSGSSGLGFNVGAGGSLLSGGLLSGNLLG
jgi:hypothetical protein